ncbi:MAG: cytochrome bd ubiquinol oxidase subunit [Thermoleophilaceae bacterium]|jgi:cytochrome d ubiquinol oxidase subunit I|nr:cytochrome bd ubiquinol oxidase subunit [Thermoleophilaceae bacterium]
MSLPLAASELLLARQQMAFTLGFHIILASLGVGLPAITLIANWWGLRKNDDAAITLARRWSHAMALLFAVGAVTGTVLSFEMGVLWPRLMARFGEVLGVPFAVEGIFFFTEAIFVGLYIYGWKRLSPRAHLLTGIPIVIAGLGGTLSVVAANSWMNQPGGITMDSAGKVTDVRPLEVIFNGAAGYEVPHMLLAAYLVAGFLVASIYAVGWLKGRRDRIHKLGFLIPFTVATIAMPLQFLVGDTAARAIAVDQPAKFASMEYILDTGPNQTEWLGGVLVGSQVKFGIGIPDLDSILVGFSPSTVVTGLDQIPEDERPPAPTLLHLAFDAMVGIASALLLLVGWFAFSWWRRREPPESVWFWRASALSGIGCIVALESGWIVTEVGRQPWVVHGLLRTEDAVTGASGIAVSLAAVVVLYTVLGIGTILALRAMSRRWRTEGLTEQGVPYGPPADEEAT